VHVNYSIWGWVGASNNDPAQGLHTLKSGPDEPCKMAEPIQMLRELRTLVNVNISRIRKSNMADGGPQLENCKKSLQIAIIPPISMKFVTMTPNGSLNPAAVKIFKLKNPRWTLWKPLKCDISATFWQLILLPLHAFRGLFSKTNWVSRYQKLKLNQCGLKWGKRL